MKSIKIPLPQIKSIEMLLLAGQILKKHTEDANNSPLNDMPWDTLKPMIEQAVNFQANAEAHRVQGKICIEERNKLLDEIQDSIRGCRNILSGVRMKSMQTLGEWGFHVIETNFTRTKTTTKVKSSTQIQPPDNVITK